MANSRKARVLAIDDEVTMLDWLKTLLEQEGYEVRTSLSGARGEELFRAWRPDVVVTDLMLPDVDGVELLKRFKQANEDAEVIVLTGYGSVRSAVDAIRAVGPGGHFFGTPHTQSRYKTAFYAPIISDWRNFETWSEAGSPTAVERANKIWKERLATYEEPYMDPAIREELNAFVEKRKAEGGAPTDF